MSAVAHYPWSPCNLRLIIPIANESPCSGKTNCQSTNSNSRGWYDEDTIDSLIVAANTYNVTISMIMAPGGGSSNGCLQDLYSKASVDTGGVVSYTSVASDLIESIKTIVRAKCEAFENSNGGEQKRAATINNCPDQAHTYKSIEYVPSGYENINEVTHPEWKYTQSDPGSSWTSPSFNDNAWNTGYTPMANTNSYSSSKSGNSDNNWDTTIITDNLPKDDTWLRYSFYMHQPVESVYKLEVRVNAEASAAIYLNSDTSLYDQSNQARNQEQPFESRRIWNTIYELPVSNLNHGENTLSLFLSHQNDGNDNTNIYIDAKLAIWFKYTPCTPPLIDSFGDGSICVDVNECLFADKNDCFEGVVCTDVDLAEANGCGDCGFGALLTVTEGYTCGSCPTGYTGDGKVCTNVNECNSNPCFVPETCVDTIGSYTCGSCPDGYTGDGESCVDINECLEGLCHNVSYCTNTDGGYTCDDCPDGFIDDSNLGDNSVCIQFDPCATNDCDDNAECMASGSSHTCQCETGFSDDNGDGTACSNINECSTETHTCDGNATCSDTIGSFTCSCNNGYFGNGYICVSEIDENGNYVLRIDDPVGCFSFDEDCQNCTNFDGCGFCGQTGECLPGDENGPIDAIYYSSFDGCPALWTHKYRSHVVKTDFGFPVNPSVVHVYLLPDDPTTFQVSVTRPRDTEVAIDMLILQDASFSMIPFMQNFASIVPKVLDSMLATYRDANFGYAQFIEKNIRPMSQTAESYSFSIRSSITVEMSLMQIGALKAADQNVANADRCEDLLTALLYSSVCEELVSWREGSRRLVFVVTDACYHVEGDSESYTQQQCYKGCAFPDSSNPPDCACSCNCAYIDDPDVYFLQSVEEGNCFSMQSSPAGTTPINPPIGCPFSFDTQNDYVCDPDPGHTGIADDGLRYTWGSDEDYPALDEIKNLLIQQNIVPIFSILDDGLVYPKDYPNYLGGYNTDETDDYTSLVDYLGFGVFLAMEDDSGSSLLQDMLDAVEELGGRVKLIEKDPVNYVLNITPADGYVGVQETETVIFEVTVGSPVVDNIEFNLLALGFGECNVKVYNYLPCFGCDGEENSEEFVDLCGICEPLPENEDNCLGCDGVPNSNTVEDFCGVCGGDNDCFGCDGVLHSNSTRDECDVCNGDNSTCLGCDGVPNSGLVEDLCGVCDGNNDCLGCDEIPNSGLVIDACGVCDGDNSTCLGCDGVPNSGAVEDDCGECLGNNQCLNITRPPVIPPETEDQTPLVVGVAISALIALGIGAAVLVALGTATAVSPLWMTFGAGGASVASNNPLFQAAGNAHENALYNGAGGDDSE
eukprot:TRINITY_DN1855_c0_g1_i1.p1 TRINITY_DN1855_c0_g1~~TRINITY_DN1855_c0_g1_i1.p1  ORF type:complete len:1457 (-),score=361.01 TRINITY_DN1855_c0_g1_i1:73-4035(-)